VPPTTAYIALGANLGDRQQNLRAALDLLNATPGVRVTGVSSFLENPAVGGPPDSPPFLNAAAELETTLEPRALLDRLLEIERTLGRERRQKWGPRPIDLDLLLYGDRILDEPDLKVPHPLMHERRFVLQPLAEIAPASVHPILRLPIDVLLRMLEPVSGDKRHPSGIRTADRSSTVRPSSPFTT
jgi:2-amino-4-hydroxy-6-hydroxymethyldihydropteridine diphosphokinase